MNLLSLAFRTDVVSTKFKIQFPDFQFDVGRLTMSHYNDRGSVLPSIDSLRSLTSLYGSTNLSSLVNTTSLRVPQASLHFCLEASRDEEYQNLTPPNAPSSRYLAQLNSTQLNSTQLNSTQLNSTATLKLISSQLQYKSAADLYCLHVHCMHS